MTDPKSTVKAGLEPAVMKCSIVVLTSWCYGFVAPSFSLF
uniref:Uncharacterized protein n=1 Tax=Setaria italica TaxID=4555 RepID=K3Z285_SETIT